MKSSCLNSTLLDDLNAVLRVANEEAPNVLVVEIGEELGVLAVENRDASASSRWRMGRRRASLQWGTGKHISILFLEKYSAVWCFRLIVS